MDNESLLNDESIECWIREHAPNGEQKLLIALKNARVPPPGGRYVLGWFQRQRQRGSGSEPLGFTETTGRNA